MIGPASLVIRYPDGRLTWAGFLRLMATVNHLRRTPDDYPKARALALQNSTSEIDLYRLDACAREFCKKDSPGCMFLADDVTWAGRPS